MTIAAGLATRLYCLCAPALVAALLLVLWNRVLPQLLRKRWEKIVPQDKLLAALLFKISGRDRNPRKRHGHRHAGGQTASRQVPEEEPSLSEVSQKIVDQ